MRLLTACVAILAMAAPSHARCQQPNPLTATYSVKVGDMAASMLSEFLKLRTDLRDPALVTYEPETNTIDVEVFASPSMGSKTDQARTTLGKYWEFIQTAHIAYVERRFKAKLSAAHYRLVYYDVRAEGGPQIILQYVNGQYLLP